MTTHVHRQPQIKKIQGGTLGLVESETGRRWGGGGGEDRGDAPKDDPETWERQRRSARLRGGKSGTCCSSSPGLGSQRCSSALNRLT